MRHAKYSALVAGASWLVGGEVFNRLTRIFTAIILARSLGVELFALAAILLATFEIVRMLTHNGFGARIVSAAEESLPAITATIHRANWALALVMVGTQLALAMPLAKTFGTPDLTSPMVALGIVYLIYPFATVQVFLAQRKSQFRRLATATTAQTVSENMLVAALAISGFGLWALVLPKLAVAIGWVLLWRRMIPWRPEVKVCAEDWHELFAYSRTVFAAETVRTVASHIDKFIVGKALGIEALGIYAFASNAGTGIALSISTAAGNAILPFIAGRFGAERERRSRLVTSLTLVSLTVVPLLLLQALLAPILVPILFGIQWAPAIPTLTILCLAAIAKPYLVTISQFYRATGNVGDELRMAVTTSGLTICGLLAGLPFGITGAALGIMAASLAVLPWAIATSLATCPTTMPKISLKGAAS